MVLDMLVRDLAIVTAQWFTCRLLRPGVDDLHTRYYSLLQCMSLLQYECIKIREALYNMVHVNRYIILYTLDVSISVLSVGYESPVRNIYGSNTVNGSLLRTTREGTDHSGEIYVRIIPGERMACSKHALTIRLIRIRVDKYVLTIRPLRTSYNDL